MDKKQLKELWNANIKFKLPQRTEIILITLAIFSLFLLDVLQNKFLDLGIDYKVHLIESITFTALSGFWVGLLAYHIFLFGLISYSFFKKGTSFLWDGVVGVIAIFGTIVIAVGAISGIYTTQIPFFSFTLNQITFYHIFGILPQIIAMIYFAVTE